MDPETSSGGISGWLERNPTLALGAVIIFVLLIGATLLRHKAASATASAATQGNLSGLGTDTGGNPIVYVPTQTAFTTYNATDASQTVTDTGSGSVTTGSTSAGNTTQPPVTVIPPVVVPPVVPPTPTQPPVLPHPVDPPRKPPVQPPWKVSMQWNQRYSTRGQSLNLIAEHATGAMNAEAGKLHINNRFTVTGQQIYNNNKTTIDTFFAAHHIKTDKLTTATTGVEIIIPHLVTQ
jgi:hypothetical protein